MTTDYKTQKKNPWTTAAIVGAIIALLAVVTWVALHPVREQAAQEAAQAEQEAEKQRLEGAFLDECHEDIKDQLRDPSSAEFESESGVIVGDDGQYTILSDARARNGFGGMNNFRIACTAYYDETTDSFDIESQIID